LAGIFDRLFVLAAAGKRLHRRTFQPMRAELAGPVASAVERLLTEGVVTC
jgi:hypothetical protein